MEPSTKSGNCPKCGAELSGNTPAGICPACLLQAGLASDGDAGRDERFQSTALNSHFVPPSPQELAKHFPQLEILELLGKGGMGAVYKARQPGLDRLVAVKILPPEIGVDPAFAERFMREARALARLSHQNIVSVFDFGCADGLYYFVMEFVDGVNLRQIIRPGELDPQWTLSIVPQICEALQFAHDEGIVHRDIKPENILVNKQGRVKIADFGLAKLLGATSTDHTLTGTGQVMGTIHYMAPEQMRGAGSVDHRADIYALGVVFYELLTGNLPIGKFEPPSRKVQVDVRLDDVVLRALESEPSRRYQQAGEVKTAVDAISRHSTNQSNSEEVPQVSAAGRFRQWMRLHARHFAWIGIALLVVVTILAFRSFRDLRPGTAKDGGNPSTSQPQAASRKPQVRRCRSMILQTVSRPNGPWPRSSSCRSPSREPIGRRNCGPGRRCRNRRFVLSASPGREVLTV